VRFTKEHLDKLKADGTIRGYSDASSSQPSHVGAGSRRMRAATGVAGKKYGDAPLVLAYQIKPLSVNEAWKGERHKTDDYRAYEKHVMVSSPPLLPPPPPYRIIIEFGFSNQASDWDNPVKPTQDAVCKKYNINDKDIMEGHVYKRIVPVGEEYFTVTLETI